MRKHKQHILYIIVILLSLVSVINTNNTSALLYQSNVGVGFAFNPTLSVSLSSSDLVIANLVPGNTLDSNIINVSVASNAAYGYTLSAMANGNNSNLTHSNGTNTFSSIATNADLADLEDSEDTNIWGYSYKDNTVEVPAWSNYNGLSNSNGTTLINTNSNVSSNLDFKIAAKSSNTQPSGTYTGTINFIAVTNVAPMNLFDSFLASGAEMHNGYFKMQDMTHSICANTDIKGSELQLIDVRDNKIYWVAKLKDGNCWMTQNLDFDIQKDAQGNVIALTSELTDLVDGSLSGAYMNGYTYTPDPNNPDTSGIYNGLITWTPSNSTNKAYTLTSLTDWGDSNFEPYSYDAGQYYPDTNTTKENAGNHALSGNYYNWNSAIASNDTTTLSTYGANATNSLCSKNWKLPTSSEYTLLDNSYNLTDFGIPYFIQSGQVESGGLGGKVGRYWASTINNNVRSHFLNIQNGSTNPNDTYQRYRGFSMRCLAR
jgi:hypothetical protein